jgi:carbohydrate-binding DOMON domain-containing protein
MSISVLASEGRVTVRVPLSALPEDYDPVTTAFAVALLGQEGYPSAGVRRVRDIAPMAAQWKFGGGDSSKGDTRVVDAIDPEGDQPSLADGVMPLVLP